VGSKEEEPEVLCANCAQGANWVGSRKGKRGKNRRIQIIGIGGARKSCQKEKIKNGKNGRRVEREEQQRPPGKGADRLLDRIRTVKGFRAFFFWGPLGLSTDAGGIWVQDARNRDGRIDIRRGR